MSNKKKKAISDSKIYMTSSSLNLYGEEPRQTRGHIENKFTQNHCMTRHNRTPTTIPDKLEEISETLYQKHTLGEQFAASYGPIFSNWNQYDIQGRMQLVEPENLSKCLYGPM